MYRRINWGILVPVLLLLGIGLLLVLSSSTYFALYRWGDELRFFKSHIMWIVLGLIFMGVMFSVNYRIYDNFVLIFGMAFLSLILMMMTFMFAETKGAQRAIWIGNQSFMPIDFAKVAMVFTLSYTLTHFKANRNKIVALLLQAIFPLLLMAITVFQPNFSSTIILASVFGMMLYMGFNSTPLVIGFGAGLISSLVFIAMIAGYRIDRITRFMKSFRDISSAQTQYRNAGLAIASGGIFGVGPGKSIFNKMYIPEPHNDMIMSTLGEEFGLMGNLVVLVIMFVLIWNIFRVSIRCKDSFGKLLSFGIGFMVFMQMFINMGTTLGLLPPTGVPLPFISYGGTNLIATLGMMGIVLNIHRMDSKS